MVAKTSQGSIQIPGAAGAATTTASSAKDTQRASINDDDDDDDNRSNSADERASVGSSGIDATFVNPHSTSMSSHRSTDVRRRRIAYFRLTRGQRLLFDSLCERRRCMRPCDVPTKRRSLPCCALAPIPTSYDLILFFVLSLARCSCLCVLTDVDVAAQRETSSAVALGREFAEFSRTSTIDRGIGDSANRLQKKSVRCACSS